jgi:hypothetical protein
MKNANGGMNRGAGRLILAAAALGLWLAPAFGPADARADVKKDMLEMTGGKRAKVVWNQGDKVKFFDTQTGKIEDLPIDHGSAPLLSKDGRRIFVSTGKAPDDRHVVMYDTETKKVTKFPKGPGNNLLAVWRDPKTGQDWVYVNGSGDQGENWDQAKGGAIHRFPVDKPDARELFWDRTTSHIYLMFSADGTRACFEPSWANIGQLKLAFTADGKVDQEKSEYKQFGAGCFPSMAPDNSYRLFRLDGAHRTITLHDADNTASRQVNVSSMVDGRNIWLTRWSTHPRYITLMGPDSNEARIWMGRFNEDFTEIETWVQVNDSGPKCMQSHSWVEQEPEPGAGRGTPGRRPERVVEPAPEWPAVTGAVFSLRDTKIGAPRVAFDDRGRDLMAFSFVERGRALYGRNHELVCDGGSFIAQDAGAWIAKQVAEAGAFSLEAVVTPTEVTPTTKGVLMTFADDSGEDFAILQDKNWLYLRLKDTPPIGLFPVEAGKTMHMLVAFQGGKGVIYRNGRAVRSGPLPATAAAWQPRELVLGASGSGAEPWRGRLDCIAVYPRALTAEEAARQASAVQGVYGKRTPPTTIRFKGTLTRQAKTSTLEEIRPYSRSLTAAEYKVDQVLSGQWSQPTILVYHWMIMDNERLPIADRQPGATVELSVDPLEEHPQLESNRRDDLEDMDLDAEMFYCESEPGA